MHGPSAGPLVNGENLAALDSGDGLIDAKDKFDRGSWTGCGAIGRCDLVDPSWLRGGEDSAGEDDSGAAGELLPARAEDALGFGLIGLLGRSEARYKRERNGQTTSGRAHSESLSGGNGDREGPWEWDQVSVLG